MVDFVATTRRRYDRGNPRDAGVCYACQTAAIFVTAPRNRGGFHMEAITRRVLILPICQWVSVEQNGCAVFFKKELQGGEKCYILKKKIPGDKFGKR